MIVETSAIVAIMNEEGDALDLLQKIKAADEPVTTVANAFEAALSMGKIFRNYKLAGDLVPHMLEELGIKTIGIDPDLFDQVMAAYVRYGKGTGHPAQLNFGDCFSYAAAKKAGVPLLYKGEDFAKTDLG